MKKMMLSLMLATIILASSDGAAEATTGLQVYPTPSAFNPGRVNDIKVKLENYGKTRSFDCTVKFTGGNIKPAYKHFTVNNLRHYYYIVNHVAVPALHKRFQSQPIGMAYVFVKCAVT